MHSAQHEASLLKMAVSYVATMRLRTDFDAFSESEWAFDLLYCVAFIVMDKKWEQKNASYMEFNEVLKSTRAQLEEELLMDDVLRIEDMLL
ncbi:ELMO domain-containing protein A-like protein [Tanacetum coccineum]